MNISRALFQHTQSSKTALIYYGKKFSYKDLGRFARLFAEVFISLGVQKGDRVALMMSNVPQFVFAYYGAILAGAVVTPVNLLTIPRSYSVRDRNVHVPDEIRAQIQDAAPAIILAFDFYFPLLKELQEEIENQQTKVILTAPHEFMPPILKRLAPIKLRHEGRWIKIDEKAQWLYDLSSLRRYIPEFDFFPGMNADENELTHLQYTTGTTGTPKGVMLSHKNLLSNILQANAQLSRFLSHGEEVVLGVLPFFHMYGLTVAMQSTLLAQEGTLVLVADPQDIGGWLPWVAKYKVTIIPSIPRLYERLNEQRNLLDEKTFRSVKIFINGAGALPPKRRKEFEEISSARILEGYGLSEASPVVSVCTPSDFKEGSVGKPLPETEVRIVDLTSAAVLEPGQEGEIVVRGPQVLKGYWNKPEETAKVLRDGWLYTGDIGYMDKDGFLYITDRISDMVKINGEWVYPSKVERALETYAAVKEAVVVGLYDNELAERLVACIVLADPNSDSRVLSKELFDHVSHSISNFEIPREFKFITSSILDTYKNPLGKVLRRKIREAIQKGQI